ncbi:MAG TPA: radical SAM protein [Polyangia bacterium]|nr:radical SAM protein [Polyangia bacterium]
MAAPPTEAGPRCSDDALVGVGDHAVVSRIQSQAYARMVPLNVSLELTLKCNIRCLHCYNFDRDGDGPASCSGGAGAPAPELSLEEIFRVLSELRAAGTLFLSLTGGEVLSSPHLFPVLDRALELNLAVQLLSNGTLLRPGVAARLAGYRNLLGVSISLYGATPEVHDSVTQIRGSWRRTMDGAARLKAQGVAVRLKLIVMRPNVHEVAAMRALADAAGYPYLLDLTVTARHDGTRGSLALRITDDELAALYRGSLRDLLPRGDRVVDEAAFPCNCARGNCAISARGDVFPCVSVPWAAGNVRAQPFGEIWRRSPVFQRIRGLEIADYPACAPCPDKAFCSRDRGAAYNASGSYTGTDPFVCAAAGVARTVAEEDARGAAAGASHVDVRLPLAVAGAR